MNIYMEHLTDAERYDLLQEATFDYEWAKIEAAIELNEIKDNMNKMAAELKVLQESGTDEDIVYLFSEADAAAAQANDSIFVKIKDWFARFFNAIGDFFKTIFSKADKVDNNTEVTVDESDLKKANLLDRIKTAISNFMKDPKAETILALTAAVAALKEAASAAGKAVKTTIGHLKPIAVKGQEVLNEAKKAAAQITDKIKDTKAAKAIQDAVKAIADFIKPILNKISSIAGTVMNSEPVQKAGQVVKDTAGKVAEVAGDFATKVKDSITHKDYDVTADKAKAKDAAKSGKVEDLQAAIKSVRDAAGTKVKDLKAFVTANKNTLINIFKNIKISKVDKKNAEANAAAQADADAADATQAENMEALAQQNMAEAADIVDGIFGDMITERYDDEIDQEIASLIDSL